MKTKLLLVVLTFTSVFATFANATGGGSKSKPPFWQELSEGELLTVVDGKVNLPDSHVESVASRNESEIDPSHYRHV